MDRNKNKKPNPAGPHRAAGTHCKPKQVTQAKRTESTSAGASSSQQKKASPSLPARGQPGGLDDPLRRGLSGAATKWYLRYLREGMTPEAARKKAVERKVENQPTAAPPAGKKRDGSHITPPSRPTVKRTRTEEAQPSTSGPKVSYAESMTMIKAAVLASNFPETILSKEQCSQVEELIADEIEATPRSEHNLRFGGISFRPGMVLVNCKNTFTVDWLKAAVPRLKKWTGPALAVRTGDDLPKPATVTIYLPRSSGKNTEQLFRGLVTQNIGLNPQVWHVLHKKDDGKGQLFTLVIDEPSCEYIRSEGYQLHYRFGTVSVSGLGKQPVESGRQAPLATPPISEDKEETIESALETINFSALSVENDEAAEVEVVAEVLLTPAEEVVKTEKEATPLSE